TMSAAALSNAEICEKISQLVSEFRFDEIEKYIHEDIVMEAPYQAVHQGPMRRGKAKFMAGFQFIPKIFQSFSTKTHELYDCPEQSVVIRETTSFGVFIENGKVYQNRYIIVQGFRDGKIVLWREFFNPERMNEQMLFMFS